MGGGATAPSTDSRCSFNTRPRWPAHRRWSAARDYRRVSWEDLNAEGVVRLRWWTPEELRSVVDRIDFSPSRLPSLLGAFLADGPPTTVIDVGI